MLSSTYLAAAASGGIGEMVSDTLTTFGVNWWLFLSQCISFSIVAFLLHKFAYQPILGMLEQRRQKIAEGLAAAEKSKAELAEAQAKASDILSKAGEDAQRLIDDAKNAAKAFREKEEARATMDAEQRINKAKADAEREHAKMLVNLKKEVARLVIDTTSKVAGKVLNDADQRRLSDEASKQLAA